MSPLLSVLISYVFTVYLALASAAAGSAQLNGILSQLSSLNAQQQTLTAAKAALEAKLGDSGRILLRKSGTEPVLRVMVEAPDESLARSMAEELAASITAVSAQESKG